MPKASGCRRCRRHSCKAQKEVNIQRLVGLLMECLRAQQELHIQRLVDLLMASYQSNNLLQLHASIHKMHYE